MDVCVCSVYLYISLSVWQVKSNHTVKFNRFVKKKKLNKTLQKFILHKICMHNLYTFEEKKMHLVGKCTKKIGLQNKNIVHHTRSISSIQYCKNQQKSRHTQTLSLVEFIELLFKSNLDRINLNQRKKIRFEKKSNYFSVQVLSSTLKV